MPMRMLMLCYHVTHCDGEDVTAVKHHKEVVYIETHRAAKDKRLVAFNPALTYALASNTAVLPIGGMHQTMPMLLYLVMPIS